MIKEMKDQFSKKLMLLTPVNNDLPLFKSNLQKATGKSSEKMKNKLLSILSSNPMIRSERLTTVHLVCKEPKSKTS